MTLKIDAKFEEKLSVVSKMRRIWWILIPVLEVPKICTFIGSYCARYLMFDLKNHRGVIFDDTEKWCKIWRKTDWRFGKWHEEYGEFSPEHLKCQNWNFDGTLSPRVENVWALNLQTSYVSWQWRMMQNLKRNWLVIWKLTCRIWRILTQTPKNLKKFAL